MNRNNVRNNAPAGNNNANNAPAVKAKRPVPVRQKSSGPVPVAGRAAAPNVRQAQARPASNQRPVRRVQPVVRSDPGNRPPRAQVNRAVNHQPAAKPSATRKTYSASPASRSIRAQTPSQRQEQRSRKHITGSVKNLEVKQSVKTRKAKFRVKKKKQSWRVILSRAVTFLIIFVLVSALFVGLFAFNLTRIKGPGVGDYTIQIGENDLDSTVTYVSPSDRVGANGTYNISIDRLRDYCELTVTGDSEILRYIPRGSSGQSVAFRVGTNVAWVNGVAVRMEAPSFSLGGQLFVPISFFERYAFNLNVLHNPSENKITVLREETSESIQNTAKDADPEYKPISFRLSADEVLPHITEQSVDES